MVTWGSFFADRFKGSKQHLSAETAIKFLLPVLDESFCNLSTIVHSLRIAIDITSKVNPGQQITIVCFDQPPYAIAKSAQMVDPTLGRQTLFLSMGGLHVEMNCQDCLGKLLEGSGFVELLQKVGIGGAGGCLTHANVMKTRNSTALSYAGLTLLQRAAFMETQPVGALFQDSEFAAWRLRQLKLPNFQFWDLILRVQNLVLILVSGIRNRNLVLYLEALEHMVVFMFALDNPNYARWISVYINDVKTQTPEFRLIYSQHFAMYSTPRPFSAMHADQQGEQSIKGFKAGLGGDSNLTQKPEALLRNTIISGEIDSLLQYGMCPRITDSDLSEDDDEMIDNAQAAAQYHHSLGKAQQKLFTEQVQKFINAVNENGNMFSDSCPQLCVLETREAMPLAVSTSYATIEQKGAEQYLKFKSECLELCTASINDPIKRNGLYLFSNLPKITVSKQQKTISNLKQDANLLCKALTASAAGRDVNMLGVFSHENMDIPPSLGTSDGKIRKTTKSASLQLLLNIPGVVSMPLPIDVMSRVLDGPAIVHMLKIGPELKTATFQQYFLQLFNPYIENLLKHCLEVSVVFDRYKPDSLKNAERLRRGAGGRDYDIVLTTPLPIDFTAFLRNDNNKEKLFHLIADCIGNFTYEAGKRVYVTKGEQTITSCGVPVGANIMNCAFLGKSDHEEADSRMMLPIASAFRRGAITADLRTVDSDVVIIAICIFNQLLAINPAANLWVTLGTGDNVRNYHINSIVANLGPDKSIALALVSTLTGCDTTSCFYTKGKKSCFAAWDSLPASITKGLIDCLQGAVCPIALDSTAFKCIEALTVCIYDKNLEDCSINEARRTMAAQRDLHFEKLPPTAAALLQHANRALYQALIWVKSLEPIQNLPSPAGFGWIKSAEGVWKIFWTLQSTTCKELEVLVSCKCQKVAGCAGTSFSNVCSFKNHFLAPIPGTPCSYPRNSVLPSQELRAPIAGTPCTLYYSVPCTQCSRTPCLPSHALTSTPPMPCRRKL